MGSWGSDVYPEVFNLGKFYKNDSLYSKLIGDIKYGYIIETF
jgi:hypothetical protein